MEARLERARAVRGDRPGDHDGAAAPLAPGDEPASGTTAGIPAQTSADPYAIGPDAHARAADEGEPRHAPAPQEPQDETEAPRVTAKGLPKRTPKISAPAPAARQRAGGVDAEALRRRLGGFHRGAKEGYRHSEAEASERTGETREPVQRPTHTAEPGTAQDVEASGGTVEEASS